MATRNEKSSYQIVEAATSWEWISAPPNMQRALFLKIKICATVRTAVPEEMMLGLPASWKPTNPLYLGDIKKASGLQDNTSAAWRCSGQVASGQWQLELACGSRPSGSEPWLLSLNVRLAAPQSFPQTLTPKLEIDEVEVPFDKPIEVSRDVSAGEPVLELWSNEATNGLAYGDRVLLRWRAKNLEDVELRGSAFATEPSSREAPTLPLQGESNTQTVLALASETYSLHAQRRNAEGKLEPYPKPPESPRAVQISLKTPQRGAQVTYVYPSELLPAGPTVFHFTAVNTKAELGFTATGADDLPPIKQRYPGTKDVQRGSVVLPWGPKSGSCFIRPTFAGDVRPQQHPTPIPVNHAKHLCGGKKPQTGAACQHDYDLADKLLYPHLEKSKKGITTGAATAGRSKSRKTTVPKVNTSTLATGLAAGEFLQEPSAEALHTEKDKRREWVAVATPQGLEIHVHDFLNAVRVEAAIEKIDWLAAALSGHFLGVGAVSHLLPPDTKGATQDAKGTPDAKNWRIAVVRRGKGDKALPTYYELCFPLKADRPVMHEMTLSDEKFLGAEKVRILALGTRVYVFGPGVVLRCDRSAENPRFEAEEALAPIASHDHWEVVAVPSSPTASSGYFFALSRKTGALRRFDVDEKGAITLMPPLAAANVEVAPLDLFQLAQAGESKYRADKRQIYTTAKRVGSRKTRLSDRAAITQDSALVVIGGALLVRSYVEDRKQRGVIQDRAYDPRLNVWVRCGHPFYDVTTTDGALFAMSERTLYCWTQDGSLRYHEGIELSHLGFVSTNVTPFPDPQPLPNFRGHTLKVGDTLEPGQYLASFDFGYELHYRQNGNLELIRRQSGAEDELVWETATADQGAGRVKMETGGHSVVGKGGKVVWDAWKWGWSNWTPGTPAPPTLQLTESGIWCIGASWIRYHHRPSIGDKLRARDWLSPGEFLESPNKKYRLLYCKDGNLMLHYREGGFEKVLEEGEVLWQTDTNALTRAELYENGVFAVGEMAGVDRKKWYSNGGGRREGQDPGYTLSLDDQGGLKLWTTSGPDVPWKLEASSWYEPTDPRRKREPLSRPAWTALKRITGYFARRISFYDPWKEAEQCWDQFKEPTYRVLVAALRWLSISRELKHLSQFPAAEATWRSRLQESYKDLAAGTRPAFKFFGPSGLFDGARSVDSFNQDRTDLELLQLLEQPKSEQSTQKLTTLLGQPVRGFAYFPI